MRKASKILMRIGAAFALVALLSTLLSSFIFGSLGIIGGGMVIAGVVIGGGSVTTVLVSVGASYGVSFIIAAIILFCCALFPLICTVLGFLGGRQKAGKVIFILNIVFAALLAYNFGSGYGLVAAVLLIVGSFLGLSAVKEEKATLEEQPLEAEEN